QLTGNAVRAFYGESYRGKNDITVQDLSFRVKAIVVRETEVIRAQLKRNGVTVFQGTAQFVDPHTVEIEGEKEKVQVSGDHILIACGTRPARNSQIPFDDKRILDTDSLSSMEGLPREIIVVGAGVVGLEYASFLAALGTEVTLIDQRPTLLDFVDREIIESLAYHLWQMGTTFRLGEKVTRVGIDPQRDRVFAELESGKKVQADALLYAVGRQANGDQLRLEAAGLKAEARGKLVVNQCFPTEAPPIYAAGAEMGFR